MDAKEKATDPLAPSYWGLFRFVSFATTSTGIRQGLAAARANPMMILVRRRTRWLAWGLIAIVVLQWLLSILGNYWVASKAAALINSGNSGYFYFIYGFSWVLFTAWHIFRFVLPVLCARWLYREFWTRQDPIQMIPMTFEQKFFGLLLPILIPVLAAMLFVSLIREGQVILYESRSEYWGIFPWRKIFLKGIEILFRVLFLAVVGIIFNGFAFSLFFARALVRDHEPAPRSRAPMRLLWTPALIIVSISVFPLPIAQFVFRAVFASHSWFWGAMISEGNQFIQFIILYWFWRMDIPLARAWLFMGSEK